MLKMYEIYYSNLAASAKFKALDPDDAERIYEQRQKMPRMEYVLLVLEMCVFNIKTDISAALRKMSKEAGDEAMTMLYNGCIMLNPALDPDTWVELTASYNLFSTKELPTGPNASSEETQKNSSSRTPSTQKRKAFSISQSKFLNLERHLLERVIGQDEAITKVCEALKRAQAGLNDLNRPLGVFMFAGPSGVGKTHLAKELHQYLYENGDLVRIDCGEYQHKHENQKLLGSPPGYIAHDEGSQFTKAVAKNPNTVILLDEAEKAHPDFWHTFLKVFDDGAMTDNKGNNISFKNAIIIITSNLGNEKVSKEAYGKSAGFTREVQDSFDSKVAPKREMVERLTKEEIRRFFKPEFLNRLDDIIVFNHLEQNDLMTIAELEMMKIANKLSRQNMNLSWDDDSLSLLVRLSGRAMEGARGMSKVRREKIENSLADLLLNTKHPKGTIFNVSVEDDHFVVN